MAQSTSSQDMSDDEIFQNLVVILEEMTSDWDLEYTDGIRMETRLIEELEFESIDVVQLVSAIEDRLQKRGLPFEELLIQDGNYVDEITISEIVSFLSRHLV
ncbi:MAG: acyl carrier protein [Pseudomonadota bacterium]|nr:acyl carrier protein [Pseudomonadota bacterium]